MQYLKSLSMYLVSLLFSVTIVVYGHTHFCVFLCVFVCLLFFMQYLKSLSVSHVCLSLEDVDFCDNCSLWSYTFLFVFVCFCLFVLCFFAISKKFVCFSCMSSSRGRRFL